MLSIAGLVAWRFQARLVPGSGKHIENLAGIWTLVLYLSVGAAPLLWRWWTGGAE